MLHQCRSRELMMRYNDDDESPPVPMVNEWNTDIVEGNVYYIHDRCAAGHNVQNTHAGKEEKREGKLEPQHYSGSPALESRLRDSVRLEPLSRREQRSISPPRHTPSNKKIAKRNAGILK
ncbi:hypothetical protein TSAR_014117, partial [Trichomalopsis sarcophagae]